MTQPHDPLWYPKHLWYKGCVERSCQYPIGSFLYVFWWSLRYELNNEEAIRLWAKRPEDAFVTWRDYFVYKWNQLADHRKQHGKFWGNEPDQEEEDAPHLHQEEGRSTDRKGIGRSLARIKSYDDEGAT